MKRVIIFGTGRDAEEFHKYFSNTNICAYLDNDLTKRNKVLNGVKVLSPEMINELQYDAVFILSRKYQYDMYCQLKKIGVNDSLIFLSNQIAYSLKSDYCKQQVIIKHSVNHDHLKKKIWLISNEAEFSGAPIALYHTAKILKQMGYWVAMVTPDDGPILSMFNNIAVETLVDTNIKTCTLNELDYISDNDTVIINTAVISNLLLNIGKKKNVIWWLHEPYSTYGFSEKLNLQIINNNNIKYWCVSNIALRSLRLAAKKEIKADIIPCCIDNNRVINKYCRNNTTEFINHKFTFLLIGYVAEIKGQELFVKAANSLPDSVSSNMQFISIGRIIDNVYMETKVIPNNKKNRVMFLEEKTPKEIDRFLDCTDVLVCCSLEETLSEVSIQAMQHYKACIVSDTTGIAKYIIKGKNGIIIHHNNWQELREAMIWCYENPNVVHQIGINARQIYEDNFTEKIFADNLNKLLKSKIKIL